MCNQRAGAAVLHNDEPVTCRPDGLSRIAHSARTAFAGNLKIARATFTQLPGANRPVRPSPQVVGALAFLALGIVKVLMALAALHKGL